MDEDVKSKLDEILSIVTKTATMIAAPATDIPPTNVALAPYELPALTVGQLGNIDENFIQRDGSVWLWSTGFSPAGTTSTRAIVQKYYGYISPRKCPRLWELVERVLGTQGFAAWEADWQAHKFGIYTTNPADTAPDVSMDDLVKLNNFMMLDFKVHRVRDWPQ